MIMPVQLKKPIARKLDRTQFYQCSNNFTIPFSLSPLSFFRFSFPEHKTNARNAQGIDHAKLSQ